MTTENKKPEGVEERRTVTHHLSLCVRGILTNWPKAKLKKLFRDDETGKLLTADEAKEYLMDCLAEGKEVLPMGKECEGFDYKTGCPGHPKPNQ